MAFTSYFKNRYSAYRRGTRSTRRWYSGSRKRAWGNSRAARQQRDACTVTISRLTNVSVPVAASATSGTAFIAHWDSLRQSTYFPNYSSMYDQIKIDKIRVKVTGTNAGASTDLVSPTVVLAFDRNGLDSAQLNADGISLTTGVQGVSTYSSAQSKQWSVGNAFTMWQTIYPSTIMEKGQYVPTESLTTSSATDNPAYVIADSTMPFKPVTLFGISTNGTEVTAAQTFIFSVELEYTVTFRGMRKPVITTPSITLPITLSYIRFSDKSRVTFFEFTYAVQPLVISLEPSTLLLTLNAYDSYYYFAFQSNLNGDSSVTISIGTYYYLHPHRYPGFLDIFTICDDYDEDFISFIEDDDDRHDPSQIVYFPKPRFLFQLPPVN